MTNVWDFEPRFEASLRYNGPEYRFVSTQAEVAEAMRTAPQVVKDICAQNSEPGWDALTAENVQVAATLSLGYGYWFIHLPEILRQIDRAGWQVVPKEEPDG